jgi:hypothetical protein
MLVQPAAVTWARPSVVVVVILLVDVATRMIAETTWVGMTTTATIRIKVT